MTSRNQDASLSVTRRVTRAQDMAQYNLTEQPSPVPPFNIRKKNEILEVTSEILTQTQDVQQIAQLVKRKMKDEQTLLRIVCNASKITPNAFVMKFSFENDILNIPRMIVRADCPQPLSLKVVSLNAVA